MLDIAIIGGGATGGALAVGLKKYTDYSVALIDAGEPPKLDAKSIGFDQRTVALSHSSMTILDGLGIGLSALTTSPIKHIHVSDQHHAGQTRLHADEQNVEAFGYVVSLAALGTQIYTDLQKAVGDKLQYQASTKVETVTRYSTHTKLTLSNGQNIDARLVVLAEGGRTSLAESFSLHRQVEDYQQTALTFVTETTEPHNGWAYERFTEQGPLALLPLTEHQFGVVWTVEQSNAAELLNTSKTVFLRELQQAFGFRCGLFTDISDIESYPLALRQLNPFSAQGAVAVGNAAQALHPIAGQGVNLGFRDVNDLINHLKHIYQEKIGSLRSLSDYALLRSKDKTQTISLTDGLVTVFSNGHLPLIMGRNIALTAMNLTPLAKDQFAQQAMGYSGN